jgi:intracellular sulfur oxidation DsrE/DsrF family protein
MILKVFSFVLLIGMSFGAGAQEPFSMGPVIKDFGPTYNEVVQTRPLQGDEHFKVAFDVGMQGDQETPNRQFVSLARFLNMHVKAGVPIENIQLALVVHGKASFDLLKNSAYDEKYLIDNPNVPLLQALLKAGVQVAICAQSAGFLGIKNEDLLPGVEVALSAMTKHALLQQQGYTLNPF